MILRNQVRCLAILALLLPLPLRAEDAAKKSAPGTASLKDATNLVNDVYKDELAAAKSGDQKAAIAQKMLGAANNEKDAAAQFALLLRGSDIARDAGNIGVAFTIIDALNKEFDIDAVKMKGDVGKSCAAAAVTPEARQAVAEQLSPVIWSALAGDRFDIAKSMSEITLAAARGSSDPDAIKQAVADAQRVKDAELAFNSAKSALLVLADNPKDPEANLKVGRYRCIYKGDWDKGLGLLALSSDALLKAVSEKELAGPKTAEEKTKLADAWWDLGEKEGPVAKGPMEQHAGKWYNAALPELTGLAKARVEKRLSTIAGPAAVGIGPRDPDTKRVVDAGLKWLAAQQGQDGSWVFLKDRTKENDGSPVAATALAALAFLHAGQNQQKGDYQAQMGSALSFLTGRIKVGPNGGDISGDVQFSMYLQGFAAITLCEAFAQTHDGKMKAAAQNTINYIIYAQDPKGGGWTYKAPSKTGDTSILGWQVTALKIATDCGLQVPRNTLAGASHFLDSVEVQGSGRYRYVGPKGEGTDSMTAVGLMSRLRLGTKRDVPAMKAGVASVQTLGLKNDLYYDYYATCLMHEWGGTEWEGWQKELRKKFLDAQDKAGDNAGSWTDKAGWSFVSCGRVGNTAIILLMLDMTD